MHTRLRISPRLCSRPTPYWFGSDPSSPRGQAETSPLYHHGLAWAARLRFLGLLGAEETACAPPASWRVDPPGDWKPTCFERIGDRITGDRRSSSIGANYYCAHAKLQGTEHSSFLGIVPAEATATSLCNLCSAVVVVRVLDIIHALLSNQIGYSIKWRWAHGRQLRLRDRTTVPRHTHRPSLGLLRSSKIGRCEGVCSMSTE